MNRYWLAVHALVATYTLPYDLARQVWSRMRDALGFPPDADDAQFYADLVEQILEDLLPSPKVIEEREVTIHYTENRTHAEIDITVRVIGPPIREDDLLRRLIWREIRHGDVSGWTIRGIDWRRKLPKGRAYVNGAEDRDAIRTALIDLQGPLRRGTWRFGTPDDT